MLVIDSMHCILEGLIHYHCHYVLELNLKQAKASVRGHLSVSLLPLSSPTLSLCICIPPPHLCTISKDHT
jgi:hypothetical protein